MFEANSKVLMMRANKQNGTRRNLFGSENFVGSSKGWNSPKTRFISTVNSNMHEF